MATDYGVRKGLIDKGIANEDIGFDPNSGYVQVKGRNFIKPEMNVQGTTYTSQPNFEKAFKNHAYGQRQQQQQQLTDQYVNQATGQPAANPYMDQYTQMIKGIQDRMNAPQQDVYSTPQYAAAQAQQQRAAQQGIRSAQESLGSSGFGRSTALGQSAQRVQNDANEYLATQLVPQIQQQLAAQRQAEIGNQMSLLNPVMGLMNRQDTQDRNKQTDMRSVIDLLGSQGQNDINNQRNAGADARAEAGLTGNYMPQGARDIINNILGLKRQAEQQGVTPEQMGQFKTAADEERAKLYQMGVDPNVVGFDANYDQASQNAANYRGIPTLQGKGQAFDQDLATRDQTLQETQVGAQLTGKLPDGSPTYASGQDTMRNTAQYAGMYNGQPTMQKIMQDAQLANMTSDNLRQAEAEARATGNNQLAKRFEIWDRTGTAPDGIPGVAAGTPLGGKKSTAQTAETYGKVIDKVAKYTNDSRTGKPTLSNPQQVEDSIILSGLSDYEQYRLYKQHGLPWDDPIPQAPGK